MTLDKWRALLENQGISGDEWYALLSDWQKEREELQKELAWLREKLQLRANQLEKAEVILHTLDLDLQKYFDEGRS